MLTKLLHTQHHFYVLTSKSLKKSNLELHEQELAVLVKCKDKHTLDLIQNEEDCLYSLNHCVSQIQSANAKIKH